MASNGIGRLLEMCLDALETGDASAMDPKLWAYEAKGNMTYNPPGLPKSAGKTGSSNFGVVVNVCELVRQRDYDRARVWLAQYFDRQGPGGDLGHMLLEPLSTTYGEAHIVSALIAYALGIKEAGPFLERELALCLLHKCTNGEIVSASTRAGKTWKQGHRQDFVALALRNDSHRLGTGKNRSLIERAFALENGWRAPLYLRAFGASSKWPIRPGLLNIPWRKDDGATQPPLLDSIRFASGPLMVTHHENGHVSRWETGPLCYASPLVAVAVSYSPFNVRYVIYPGKMAAPFGEIASRYDPEIQAVVVAHAAISDVWRILDISDLGPVVAAHRFEAVEGGKA